MSPQPASLAAPSALPSAEMPLWTEIGSGDGPTILLTGGVHGDEYEAQVVLRQLAARIDPARLNGRLRIVPIVNHPAACAGLRVATEDGKNMNRVFPGQPDGTLTERIADWLVTRMFPGADLLIDVHAGGRDVAVVPMVFGFSSAGCRIGPEALRPILHGWGYRFVQHMDCVPGTICHAALQDGLASVEVEGGGGALRSDALEVMTGGILNGLVACGVMAGTVPAFDGIEFDVPECAQIHAPARGVVEHVVPLGARVDAGQTIALLHVLNGPAGPPRPIAAPAGGIVLRQSQSAWLGQGRQIGNIGIPR
ncbi:succinylglutamate desuccinylase/aspartoacylase family protein [Xinfangfangia pollutisoli]|uniref:succinylglutamate desuccinylase/aspartoacylase family protein n=1 Tax=Xinfangfangia pollutisoli TaxID=2865960 RepID=UPI001CD7FD7E|nr:succinylglutamate desuccinylase/aspartoacylase family protein [Xinfangfangia pollutisoli]